jgi:hypothetical protein
MSSALVSEFSHLIYRSALRLGGQQENIAELVERRDALRRRADQLFHRHDSRRTWRLTSIARTAASRQR